MGLIRPRVMLLLATMIAIASACSGPPAAEAQSSSGGLAKIFVDGTTMAGSGTLANPIHSLVTMNPGIFGDGSDGPCVFDGVTVVAGTTLFAPGTWGDNAGDVYVSYSLYAGARDLFCSTITVSNNVLFSPQDFRTFASISITLNGNAFLGNPGVGGATGANGGAGGGGASGAGVIPGESGNGGAGNAGAGSPGASGAGGTPRGMPSTSLVNAGNGGSGAAGAGGAGGSSGAALSAASGDIRTLDSAIRARTPTGVVLGSVFMAGGGGAGDGAGHKGGGGGGEGTWTVVASPIITTNNTSALTAQGGLGGAGDPAGNTGGGGGGTGGILVVAYTGAAPRMTVAGGVGGAGHGTGTAGVNGNDGLLLSFKVGIQ